MTEGELKKQLRIRSVYDVSAQLEHDKQRLEFSIKHPDWAYFPNKLVWKSPEGILYSDSVVHKKWFGDS